jgi:transposase InsO family protein
MDGRGRVFDNIFVERLWRTVKYEDVYLHHYDRMTQGRAGLVRYFRFYNTERPHQSLGWRTPHDVYFGIQEAIPGGPQAADAAVTAVGLRPPSVTAACPAASTLNSRESGLDIGG